MSSEVQRKFFIKLFAFSLGMGAVGHFVVGPKVIEASERTYQLEVQSSTIAAGEIDIQRQAVEVAQAKESMRAVTDRMLEDLQIDSSIQSHQLLQRYAVSNGLTVTRVEPLQSTFSEVMTGFPEQRAKIEEKIFRIECQGSFAGIVAFIDELQDGPGRACLSSFRIMPSSEQSVSLMMTVKLIELVDVPGHIKQQADRAASAKQNSDTQGDEQ